MTCAISVESHLEPDRTNFSTKCDFSRRIVGIIAEFNPFHDGHRYIIDKAKELAVNCGGNREEIAAPKDVKAIQSEDAPVVVSVMSGNFMQRGEPAVCDKWTRAKIAVENGVNLVVELPTIYACNSAEFFAKGAVDILEGFGCVDALFFGSESGDAKQLIKVAKVLVKNEKEISASANGLLRRGTSYPKARESFLGEILGCEDVGVLREPNNILALEYIKHLKKISPVTIERKGDSYHVTGTKERRKLKEKNLSFFAKMEQNYFNMVATEILKLEAVRLNDFFAVDEGLGNKLKKEIRFTSNTDELIDVLKSKVYTRTRISRMLSQILLGITGEDITGARSYIRILALDKTGAAFIKEVKKRKYNTIPIITNINRGLENNPQIAATIEKDVLAADIYNLITGNSLYDCSDYIKKPFIKGINT